MSSKPKPKPLKQHVTDPMYRWHDCVEYLEKKYGFELRNFAGTRFTGKPDDAPYQDFWHKMIDWNSNFGNPGIIYLSFGFLEDELTEPWVKKIIQYFKDEFQEEPDDDGLQFWVSW